MMDKVFRGRLTDLAPVPSRMVKVVFSCTQSDTEQERQALFHNAVPEIQKHCQQFGLDFQLVDMHQGSVEMSTNDHQAGALRLAEIEDAHRISEGPFFVSFIGNKYGEYVLPIKINGNEFTHIRDCAFEAGKDINVLDEWYLSVGEESEQVFVLQPISSKLKSYYDMDPDNKEQHEKDVSKWKKIHDNILEILQQCAEYVHDEGLLNEEQLHKYHMSALENELSHALLLSDAAKDRCICIFRNLEDLPQNVESQIMHNFVDIRKPNKPKIYKKAQERIKMLKETKVPGVVPQENVLHFSTPWTQDGINPDICEDHEQYLKEMCTQFILKMKEMIDQHLVKENQIQNGQRDGTPLYREALSHLQVAARESKNFVSRDSILDQVEKLVGQKMKDSESMSHVVILHGEPGSGKTSVMTEIVKEAPKWMGESSVIIPRFIGATSACQTVRDALESICMQIVEVYKVQDPSTRNVPGEYDKLVTHFRLLLEKINFSSKPIFIAVDLPNSVSLTLTKEQLKWIPEKMPSSTFMVLSLSECHALKELHDVIEAQPSIIRVTSLNDRELSDLVKQFLVTNDRPLSQDQIKIVKRAVAKNPSPAFAKLLCRSSQFMLPSGNGKEPVATTVDAANLLFQHIEEKHGEKLTTLILRYITTARYGLSEVELMDILSCDNELLSLVFPYQLPKVTRFPQRLWTAIRKDIGPLLMENHMDQRTVLCWSESVLTKVAKQRYLPTRAVDQQIHCQLADYFSEAFVNGKSWDIKRSDEEEVSGQLLNRAVAPQPILFGKTRYNLRRMSELWYHLACGGNLQALKSSVVCNFEYLLAATHASSVHHIIQDMTVMSGLILDSEMDLIRSTLTLSANVLSTDPMQLAAELIGRLLPRKGESAQLLDVLVSQAMEWCDQFTLPLLVPLASWMPVPQEPLIACLNTASSLYSIRIASDNQRVFCLSRGTCISAFLLASHLKLWEQTICKEKITCFEVAYSGQFFMIGNTNPGLIMCSGETGERLHNFKEQEGPVTCLAITKNGRRVVTGSKDAMIRVFNIEGQVLEINWRGSAELIVALAINSHDDVLVTSSADCMIRMWSLETFSLLDAADGFRSPIRNLMLSADDNFILTSYDNGHLQMTCLATGTEIYELMAHKERITDYSIAPNSSHVAVVTVDNTLHLYDLRTGDIVQSYSPHKSRTLAVRVSSDGHFFITAADNGELKLWTLPRKISTHVDLSNHHEKVTVIAISRDNHYAVTGSADCTMKLWSLDLCQVVQQFSDHEKPITCLALADNGSFAVSGSEDTTVRVWSTGTGVQVVCFTEHHDLISQVLITSDNKRILTADYSNYMKLWVAESGEVLLSCMGPSAKVILTPDNNFAISGDGNELMKIWSVGSGESVKTINHVQTITCITVTKDGHYTVTGSEDMSLKIWETQTGKLTQILAGHDEKVTCVSTAEHNRHVVSGSEDKTLIVWNMSTGEVEKTLTGHTDIVTSVKMTADGSVIISGSQDGTLRVWTMPGGNIITAYYMNIPVECFLMSFDASHIVVQLRNSRCAPLLCLHNSPAAEINSQSQVDIDLKEDTASALSVRPPQLQKQTSLQLSTISNRKSTGSAPEVARIKPMITGKSRNQSYSDVHSRDGNSSHKKKQNKRSGVCAIF